MTASTRTSASGPIDGAPPRGGRGDRLAGVVVGVVTMGVALAAGQLAAALTAPPASPVLAIGQTAIDATPVWLTAFAIRTFGANDKAVLLLGMVVLLVAGSALIGIQAIRRPWLGFASIALVGALGAAAALGRPEATSSWSIPSIAAMVAGAGTYAIFRSRIAEGPSSPIDPVTPPGVGSSRPTAFDRRRFLRAALALSAVAVASEGAAVLTTRRRLAVASRTGIRVPIPSSAAQALPAGAELRVPGLSPFFTPNDAFYRVDTALFVPQLRVQDWRLRIHGMVDRPTEIGFEDLIARPLIERDITLNCVSNEVGGPYVGNARWIGVPLKGLLDELGPHDGATQILSRSADGMTIGTPTATALDGRDSMLAVAMNGQPLPFEHGFPVRMLVPGLYGYVSATKWIVDIELTTLAAAEAYWVERGWAQVAPVKTASRIDAPRDNATVQRGSITVAGVAWAQHRGIRRVEISTDGGAWSEATLAAEDTVDTWRQWTWPWDATPGAHVIRARATDGAGEVQTGASARPFPSGATGWDEVNVTVT
jgi:DMSO/TMAO reductase YedYZ molybdopterin-dependent catalytic subunit